MRIAELTTQTDRALTDADRDTSSARTRGELAASARLTRVRSFRNLLIGGILTLFALAICSPSVSLSSRVAAALLPAGGQDEVRLLAAGGARGAPAAADIDDLVAQAAKPRDVLVIEIVGLVAATLAGAIALRGMRGTSTPYAVLVAPSSSSCRPAH